jgi:hypothetical protein
MADETRTRIVRVQLPDGYQLNFEASQFKGEPDTATPDKIINSDVITEAIEATVQILRQSFERIKPDKASVTFCLRTVIESGHLIAVIVNGSRDGNLEVTFEWLGDSHRTSAVITRVERESPNAEA